MNTDANKAQSFPKLHLYQFMSSKITSLLNITTLSQRAIFRA